MRRQRALLERIDSGMEPQLAQQEADKLKESDLPELDEEFIKTLGDYKTLDELRKAIKDAITAEKRTQELNKRRSQFAEKIVEKARISLPPALVSYELDRLRAEFTEHLMQAGTTLDAYLQNTGKTDTQFNEELKPQAERNAKLQLLLNKIAEEEKLEPEQSQVEMEVAHLLQHHKDADPRSVHAYVTLQLRNKLVFDFLEKQS
jgi:trigger factor